MKGKQGGDQKNTQQQQPLSDDKCTIATTVGADETQKGDDLKKPVYPATDQK
ncbi:hypothetical protein H6771_02135 [Candidatus Peribacteria bacterium]|nr:hypothetical protein [Candidatus Peribacteria bacterium]